MAIQSCPILLNERTVFGGGGIIGGGGGGRGGGIVITCQNLICQYCSLALVFYFNTFFPFNR